MPREFLSSVRCLLAFAYRWSIDHSTTSVPRYLVAIVSDVDDQANPDDVPSFELVIAVSQLREDCRAFDLCELNSKQPDGSPSPRFWASLRLIAIRYFDVAGVPDPCGMVPAFEARQKRHRVRPVEVIDQDDEEETSIWAERAALRERVMELYDAGIGCGRIADGLRRAGLNISTQSVSAIVGNVHRKIT